MSNRLEKYLRDVAVELHQLSHGEREEQIEEIRSHLIAYCEQQLAQGKSDEEAIAAAIAQFGDADNVGRDILKSANCAQPQISPTIVIGLTVWMILAIALLSSGVLPGSQLDSLVAAHAGGLSLVAILRLGLAFAVGMCSGVVFGKNALRRIWLVCLIVTLSIFSSVSFPLFKDISLRDKPLLFVTIFLQAGFVTSVVVAGSWLGAAQRDNMPGRHRKAAA